MNKKNIKVLMSGVFDLLTSGHIFGIKVVKSYGNYLIINIVPDYRVKEKKGKDRPIKSERERTLIMNNIKGVDEVYCVKSTPRQTQAEYEIATISEIKPDIFIRGKGEDENEVKDYCEKNNIKFSLLPEIWGIDRLHTSDLVIKIKKSHE